MCHETNFDVDCMQPASLIRFVKYDQSIFFTLHFIGSICNKKRFISVSLL